MKILISPYHENDYQDLIKLWEKVYPGAPTHNNPARDLKTRRMVGPDLFLIARVKGQLLGVVMADLDEEMGWVYYLGVDPDHRRKGIASRLMSRIESSMFARGCQEIHLQIQAENNDVQAFYESLGYQKIDQLSMVKYIQD